MNKRIRTEYPPAFKEQAVLRAKAGDMSVRGLEQELGLSTNLLRQWVQAYDKRGHARLSAYRFEDVAVLCGSLRPLGLCVKAV